MDELIEIREALRTGDSVEIAESLNRVEMMLALEDRGWAKILTGETINSDGPTLDQLKGFSKAIKEEIVGSPLIKRGVGLRSSYIMSKGVNIPGYEYGPTEGTRGRPTKASKFFSNPVNKANLLSPGALDELEPTAATDGQVFFIGVNSTREVHKVPLREIAGVATHPDYPTEAIAYKRSWTRVVGDNTEEMSRWYYVDTYSGPREKEIGKVPVDNGAVIFVQRFNTQSDWVWGVPDAVAAVAWSRVYSELVNYGKAMTKTMAKVAMQFKSAKAKNAVAAASLSQSPGGSIAGIGLDADITALSTAGKTYDFGGLRPVAAMVATAFEVSVVHLLSDPGAAGSSYGSAQNLDLPTKRAIVSRQRIWAGFLERIIAWGTGVKDGTGPQVSFPSLDDPDPYREMQVVALGWNTGLVHSEEARDRVMKVGQFEDSGDGVPEGVVQPGGDGLTSAPSPDQGRSNGTGGVDSTLANDTPVE